MFYYILNPFFQFGLDKILSSSAYVFIRNSGYRFSFNSLSNILQQKKIETGTTYRSGRNRMEKFVRDKINQNIVDRKELSSRYLENCSTYGSSTELEKKAFEDGALSRKHKELMALSISIVTKCEPCIE